ncbi:MAG: hypothetical protein JWM47_4227, partial [Acidimicrobiales bacterium]|nr:hypothetical protein [Acidimicrobiales bacterium]
LTPGPVGAAMKVLGSTADPKAVKVVADASPNWNAMMHTTCVATMMTAGHAENALPQRAKATVNCRILPGHTPKEVLADLTRVVADPQVKVTFSGGEKRPSPAPPLDPKVLGPAEAVTHKMWGNIPLIPNMLPAATDGLALNIIGIPTYGLQGFFVDPDGGGLHGLNERVGVRSLYDGRDFLYEVVKLYGMQD